MPAYISVRLIDEFSTSPLLCVLCHSEGAFHYNARFVITLISLGSQNERCNELAVYSL